jgi:glycosyltransferase involved in cell wall biosynthesis
LTYRNPVKRTDRAADEFERISMERAAIVVVSSAWAAESAVKDYGIRPTKVHNLLIGANLPNPPAREDVLPRRLGKKVRLLMIGIHWEIKGGEIAYETLLSLLEAGYDAELTVVGAKPPESFSHPRFTIIPFLDKQNPEDLARFEQLWRNADFFIVPSRAEAAGVVFSEAAANALPVLATRTGGIPSLVVDGENGYTLPWEARGDSYAKKIAEIAASPERYETLCGTSRDAFEQRLNWNVWGERLGEVIRETLPHLSDRIAEKRRPNETISR